MMKTLNKLFTYILLFILVFTTSYYITMFISDVFVIQSKTDLPYILKNSNTKKEYNSIIRINTNNSFCTGVVISDNYAITAAHCVTDQFGMMITNVIDVEDSSQSYTVEAKSVALDKYRDVAFLLGDFKKFKNSKIDFYGKKIKHNMLMISCGYPSGSIYLYCTQLSLIGNNLFKYRTQGSPIFKGMSGGPVFDTQDTVVGLNSAVSTDSVIIAPLVGVLESVGIYEL